MRQLLHFVFPFLNILSKLYLFSLLEFVKLVLFWTSDLEQGHFTDDGVVDVHGNVQPHLCRKLHQELLFICPQPDHERSMRRSENIIVNI